MQQNDFVLLLHSHLPYVLNHGRWPHGSDWICEAAIETYLPLLETLRRLDEANVAAPVTIGFTPVLANQLEHPTFARELEAWFEQRFTACTEAPDAMRGTSEEPLIPLVEWWESRLERLYRLWHEIGGDIPAQFRALEGRERLEVISSAATHAFLPLLGRDESIALQLAVGLAEHERIFGRRPEGCWLPECAYRPAGPWQPFRGAYNAGTRRGLEEHLAEAGYRYFCVDAHMARAGEPLGVYGTMFGGEAARVVAERPPRNGAEHSPYLAYRVGHERGNRSVAAFVRDPRSSSRVWDRHAGYPGDGAYLEFHKLRWPGGLRLWRVTGRGTDLGAKAPYVPAEARSAARAHAMDFARLLASPVPGHDGQPGSVVVAPFDTELFGHWWFEGPDFLGDVFAELPSHPGVRAVTAAEHLDGHGTPVGIDLAEGSWGRDGDYGMWMNDGVAWTWPHIWELENRFWDMASRASAHRSLSPLFEQAARELLLLQSSDWPFIMSTGEVEDYAIRRFTGHADDCRELLGILDRGMRGEGVERGVARALTLQQRDDVFRSIGPTIAQVLSSPSP